VSRWPVAECVYIYIYIYIYIEGAKKRIHIDIHINFISGHVSLNRCDKLFKGFVSLCLLLLLLLLCFIVGVIVSAIDIHIYMYIMYIFFAPSVYM